jgi:hypothetical protein
MKSEFITSMHKPYFDHIGSVMIESWLKYWNDHDCKLIVYGEGFYHNFKTDKIVWRDWDEYCKIPHSHFSSKIKGPAITFAKKGFSFLDAMKKSSAERLIWVDADLLFFKKMPEDKFDTIIPQGKLIACFDQYYTNHPNYTKEEYVNIETRNNYGAESGFVVLNTKHKNYNEYVKEYDSLYTSEPRNKLITHWYDSEVVILAARNFLNDIEDLSKYRTTNKTQTPLNKSWISEFFNHQKAKSKLNYSKEELRKLCNL